MHVIRLAGVLMTAFGLMSGTIRSSIPILIDRQLARVWPFTYVVVGARSVPGNGVLGLAL
jgi:hypothetical protein